MRRVVLLFLVLEFVGLMYLLLTGATGLLGRYLLKELLANHVRTAVLVRSQRLATAADRIETIVVRWEQLLGRALPRPVIIEGDLSVSGLNVSQSDRNWLAKNCSRVLHSAASLKFVADPETGEPWRSNLEATKGLLSETEQLGIREFHYVSTAYVAGRRTGVVLETELDIGQDWGNVYEESKCMAEKTLRAASHLTSLTVYRPSIIVGDSQTGYTSTYHGFYTPLRVASEAVAAFVLGSAAGLRFLDLLGLQGNERKDLVPVDWVAAAIARIVSSQQLHGQTYHLTSVQPVTVATLYEVFEQVIWARALSPATRTSDSETRSSPSIEAKLGSLQQPSAANPFRESWEAVRQQMDVYRSYWRDDPQFDRTQTELALPDLPCPLLDTAALKMLAEAALRDNFGWPVPPVVRARHEIRQHLESWSTGNPEFDNETVTIGIEVTGPGGVAWQIAIEDGKVQEGSFGLPASATAIYHLTASTFDRIRKGELRCEDAIRTGRVVVFAGDNFTVDRLSRWLTLLVAATN